jgi:hypothetical protein
VHHDRTIENISRYLDDNPGLAQRINSLGLVHNKRLAMSLADLANSRYGMGPATLPADASVPEIEAWMAKTGRAYPVQMDARRTAIGIEKKWAGR